VTAARVHRSSSWGRLVVAVVLSLVVGGVSAAAVVAAAVYHAGTIDIEIDQAGGEHLSIAVPSSLVNAAVKLLPDRVTLEAASEIAPYWDACRAAVREIDRAPDGVFVQIGGPDLDVLVAKQDGRLRIDVVDAQDRVHVSVPLATVLHIVEELEPVPRPRSLSE